MIKIFILWMIFLSVPLLAGEDEEIINNLEFISRLELLEGEDEGLFVDLEHASSELENEDQGDDE